ncbi:MAG: NUDIX hydrolase [Herpetosiphon sp.]
MQTPAGNECAGGVVVLRCDEGLLLLLIADRFGNWTLPKGHLEAGETPMQAALREITEETGCTGRIIARIGRVSFPIAYDGTRCHKIVHYFLVEATCPDLVPQHSEIRAAAWFSPKAALDANFYTNNRAILLRALELLKCPV